MLEFYYENWRNKPGRLTASCDDGDGEQTRDTEDATFTDATEKRQEELRDSYKL